MKIAILGPAYPYRGGIADFNERLAHEFLSQGHQVVIYTFTLQYPGFLFPGKTQYSTDAAPARLDIRRKLNSINPLNWIKVGHELRKEKADILVIPFWMPFMGPSTGTASRIARKAGTLTVAILHNMIPHEHKPGDRILARYFVNSVDGFVALSQSVLEEISIFDKVKPRQFCRHPLYDSFGPKATRNEALAHLGLDADKRYMLFFGLIRDYKGLDLLLEAYADSRFRDTDIKLIVAGEFYGNEQKYKDLEISLGLEGKIVWESRFVPSDEVRYWFAAADLVVQPYRSATQSGISQIAYHFEKPMLVTRVGGLPEIVPNGKAGYVVEPEPSAIATAALDFFQNKRQDQFTAGIIDEKQQYSWSKMTAAVLTAATPAATPADPAATPASTPADTAN